MSNWKLYLEFVFCLRMVNPIMKISRFNIPLSVSSYHSCSDHLVLQTNADEKGLWILRCDVVQDLWLLCNNSATTRRICSLFFITLRKWMQLLLSMSSNNKSPVPWIYWRSVWCICNRVFCSCYVLTKLGIRNEDGRLSVMSYCRWVCCTFAFECLPSLVVALSNCHWRHKKDLNRRNWETRMLECEKV